MSTKAVAYYRRSTDRQEQSIGDQRKAVEARAAEHDCKIVREYVDDGISGALTTKREAFLRLIEDSASGDFDAILVYDISRFGRTDSDETGYYRHILRENGVEVVYCMDNLGTGDESDLVRGVLTWQKHKSLVNLARDTTRGMVTTAEGGWSAGGRAPYGFSRALVDRDGKVVKVLAPGEKKLSDEHEVTLAPGDPAEVAVVRDIFRMFLDGMGYRRIALALNNRGVPSARGGQWASTTIRDIILNPHHCGDGTWNRRPKGKFYGVSDRKPQRRPRTRRQRVRRSDPKDWVTVRNAHEGIVDRKTFEAPQERIKGNGQNKGHSMRHRASNYPLSGLLYCGCGSPMWGQETWRRGPDDEKVSYRYYGCASGSTGRSDHRIAVAAGRIERLVVRKLREAYEATDLRAEVAIALAARADAEHADAGQDRALTRRRIAQIDQALRNATRRVLMVEDDDLARQMLAEASTLKAERQMLQDKLAASREPDVKVGDDMEWRIERTMRGIRRLEATYKDASLEGKKAFLSRCLTTADDLPGPVVLYCERDDSGKRSKTQVLGRQMVVDPLVNQGLSSGYGSAGRGIRTPTAYEGH